MFERFTEKAIKVLMLAQEESRRLGHNSLGTEFLLLGLISEGTGLAHKALASLGVQLQEARTEVETVVGRGEGVVAVEIPFTPRAKASLELALAAAQQLGHNYIGTEHLLLGLLREGEGKACQVLSSLGVNLVELEERLFAAISGQTSDSVVVNSLHRDIIARFHQQLDAWVKPRSLGKVRSYTRFRPATGDMLMIDVSFTTENPNENPALSTRQVPELVAQVYSPSMRRRVFEAKLQLLLALGAQVGLLIDPQDRTVTMYRPNADVVVFEDEQTLTIPEVLSDWNLPISQLWPSEG